MGGRTIYELKRALSLDEFQTWLMYRAKWGVSLHRNVEFGSAIVAQSMRGGKLSDFLPNRGTALPDQVEPATVEQAMMVMPGKRMR